MNKRKSWLNRTVFGAGLTSALGDFCYETATVMLPGFLAVLGLPASALGLIEGIADSISAFTKILSGRLASRIRHRKFIVLLGYALTPLGQLLIAFANGWSLILAGRGLSWFGKGLRGPIRDTIVIQAINTDDKGRVFGFHRAADTIGAVVGPLLGVWLLGWAQGIHQTNAAEAFRLVFWLSLIPGVLAVLAFACLVQEDHKIHASQASIKTVFSEMSTRFKKFLASIGLFGAGDFSHALLILAATTQLSMRFDAIKAAQIAGSLYVLRNVIQVMLSYPVGVFADRYGHSKLLVTGYFLGAITSLGIAFNFFTGTTNLYFIGTTFILAGLYTAIEETLEPTLASEMLRKEHVADGYGVMGAVNGLTKLISSAMVGLVWTYLSPALAFSIAATLMFAGTFSLHRLVKH